MPENATPAPLAPYVSFEEFQSGLPEGKFNVIVNPELATPFVLRIANVMPVTLALVGVGLATALVGHQVIGVCIIALGALFRRAMRANAPHVLLYLVGRKSHIYHLATERAIMEVRRV